MSLHGPTALKFQITLNLVPLQKSDRPKVIKHTLFGAPRVEEQHLEAE